jgi:hypothetical protein
MLLSNTKAKTNENENKKKKREERGKELKNIHHTDLLNHQSVHKYR